MSLKYITDDKICLDIGIEIGKRFFKLEVHEGDDDCVCYNEFTQEKADEIIQFGLKYGYFKCHYELGELYYHATKAGLALLDSRGIINETS